MDSAKINLVYIKKFNSIKKDNDQNIVHNLIPPPQ